MNSLKGLFIIVVLGAIAYGAYVSITRKQQINAPGGNAPLFSEGSTTGPPELAAAATPQFPTGAGTVATELNPSNFGTAPPRFTMPKHPPAPSATITPTPGGTSPSVTAAPYAQYGNAAPPVATTLPQQNPLATNATVSEGDSPIFASRKSGQSPLPDKFDSLLKAAERELNEGRMTQAHLALSNLYNNPEMSPAQASRVAELLDQLAGHIIYSKLHLLEPPYTIKRGETLEQIAQSYNVPWQLLANINGIRDPRRLEPGKQLKVVRGPFNAVVDLQRYELMLMLAGRYAGRFPIGVGLDCAELEGTYVVCNKTVSPQYYGPNREQISAGDPRNPLGKLWIGLGEHPGQHCRLGIHGTGDPTSLHTTSGRGSIRLGDKDIEDVSGILSVGPVASRVTIRR